MSSSERKWVHDVFLSFRGEDTRRSFVSHLYNALSERGIDTFVDDKLQKGEEISSALLNAIQGSSCSIVVLSPHYAASKWCLTELVEMIKCQKIFGQLVIPIFYGVNPSDVRHQRGSYAKAFAQHQRHQRERYHVRNWREALKAVANLSGWDANLYWDDSKLITHIVQYLSQKLPPNIFRHIADYPVRIESRVQEVISKLSIRESFHVRMVGIWGMGGSGKTTIAKAIYNAIVLDFEARSFLANIREVWKQDNGQVYLKEQLISGITGKPYKKIPNIELREDLINRKLRRWKALVVLDDVDELAQLSALCNRDWFGPSSVIIITTRNKHLLKVHGVDHIYPMSEMENNESLELFSWHAFKESSPATGFIELSRQVVSYCGGLPLALEVLGSCLFEKEMPVWKSVLSKLERIPNDEVQRKLKISFDSLSDDKIKDIFLDICCFFIGMDRNYVTQILDGCELQAESGITELIERSLLQVDEYNKLDIHDLLRDMGREIIHEKFPKEPEKHSRLWSYEDVDEVLTEHIGTRAIEGLALKLPRINRECFSAEAFKEMKRLRLLQLDYVQLSGDYKHLSKRLRWLRWHGFPLRYMPDNFYQKSLVAIDLQYSNLKLVWKEPKLLERLKILNLSHSYDLTHTPIFTTVPNLEQLIVEHCPSLTMVHESIGELQNLLLVNLKDCKCLKELPRSIYQVKSLKALTISGCSLIDKLEEDFEQTESLTHLTADNTAIARVPFSLARSKSIGYISLCGYDGRAPDVFPSIIWSWLSPSNSFQFPTLAHGSFSSLVSLNLPVCDFHDLSQIVTSIPNLQSLRVNCNSNLQQTQEMASLNALADRNCMESETAPNAFKILSLMIQTGECNKVTNALVESINQGCDLCGIPQTGTSIPKLRSLELKCDSNRQQTQDIASLNALAARNSLEVEATPNASQISSIETWVGVSLRSLIIQMGGCNEVAKALVERIKQIWATGKFDQCFPIGDKYPDWFVYKGKGSSVTLKVPKDIGHILKGMILCVAYSSSLEDPTSQFLVSISIKNHTKVTFQHHRQVSTTSFEDEKWQQIASDLEPDDKVEVIVNIGHKCAIKEIIAYLIYGDTDHLAESSKRHIERLETIDTKGGKKSKNFCFSCFGC